MKRQTGIAFKYGLTALGGVLTTVVFLKSRQFSMQLPAAERYRLLCDAFTVPGLLLMLSAALIALSNAGSFHGLGYLTSFALRVLIPAFGPPDESYGDYLKRKEKKGRVKGYGFLLQVGLVFFLPALIFLLLFYLNFQG